MNLAKYIVILFTVCLFGSQRAVAAFPIHPQSNEVSAAVISAGIDTPGQNNIRYYKPAQKQNGQHRFWLNRHKNDNRTYFRRGRAISNALLFFYPLFLLGVHRFYLGYKKEGYYQLAGSFCLYIGGIILLASAISGITLGIVVSSIMLSYFCVVWLWQLCDVVRLIFGGLPPRHGRFSSRKKKIANRHID